MRRAKTQKAPFPIPTKVLHYAFLIVLASLFLAPFVWMISTSLKRPDIAVTAFLPGVPTLENYVKALTNVPFARFYFNSLFVAVFVTFGQVFTSALAAYAFARLRFPGRDKLFLCYLATMMIPHAVLMVPQFMILTNLPLWLDSLTHSTFFSDDTYFFGKIFSGRRLGVDSYFVLIAHGLFSTYGTFLLRQFMLSIPRETEEAAMIDGCSYWQIFRLVIIPVSKPALATLATFTFVNSFRSFLWPLIMNNTMEMKTLPVGLASFMDMYLTEWPVMMAGSAMMLVPMLAMFLLCQRWFVSGIQLGAVKG